MKLTNKFNIPQTFVNVVKRPTYSKGKANLSVTQLINSPKIVALSKKFEEELEQDVSEMVWSIFGSAVHKVLEHGQDENHLVEERLHAEVDGWRISGAIDLQIVQQDGIDIRDYKTVSAWSVMNEKIEWEQQLNIYAWLVETVKNVSVSSLGIVAIIRDWSRREAAGTNIYYPKAPIWEIPIKLWSLDEREEFIRSRIKSHSDCEFQLNTDDKLPDCTAEEMWERPTRYAIMKRGNVRAKSVHDNLQDAEWAIQDIKKENREDYRIEVRPGSRIRCESFCPVSNYCQQWRDYQESKK